MTPTSYYYEPKKTENFSRSIFPGLVRTKVIYIIEMGSNLAPEFSKNRL